MHDVRTPPQNIEQGKTVQRKVRSNQDTPGFARDLRLHVLAQSAKALRQRLLPTSQKVDLRTRISRFSFAENKRPRRRIVAHQLRNQPVKVTVRPATTFREPVHADFKNAHRSQ